MYQSTIILKTRPWLRGIIAETDRIGWRHPEVGQTTNETVTTLLSLFFQVLNQLLSDDLFNLSTNRLDASESLVSMLMSEFEGYGNIPAEFTPDEIDVLITICTHLLDDLIASIDQRSLNAHTRFFFERLVAYDILVRYESNATLLIAAPEQRQLLYQERIAYDHDTTHERQWI